MEDIVNRYPFNAFVQPNQYENKFINKKLGTVFGDKNSNTGLQYGYPYAYNKVPLTKEYPIDGKTGPTSIRRKQKQSYRINYITVDSRDRNSSTQIIASDTTVLQSNPMSFVNQSNIITITQANHGYSVDDFIAITNVSANEFVLNNPFSVITGKSFMRVAFPDPGHGLTLSYVSAQNIFMNISNVTSDLSAYSFNQINGLQQIYLTADFDSASGTLNANYLYISLPFSATQTIDDTQDPTTLALLPSSQWRNQGVIIDYLFVNGIPLFFINNGTPVNLNNVLPYQNITSIIDQNNYTIELSQIALQTGFAGGDCVTITSISKVAEGYPLANSYVYELKKSYKNVVRIRLVSSEFPNVQNVIQTGINDTIYWQDLQDTTDTTYSVTVPAGSYSAADLQSTLQTEMSNVPLAGTNPTQNHIFTVSINPDNNIVTFSGYVQHVLNDAMFIKYTISQVGTSQILSSAILYVVGPDRKLNVGDTVIILSAPNYDIVPSSAIIGQNTIIEVNNYTDSDNVTSHRVNGVLNPVDPVTLAPLTTFTVANCMHFLGYTDPLPTYYAIQLPLFVPLPVLGNTMYGFSPFLVPPTMNTTFICNTQVGPITDVVSYPFRMFFDKQNTMGNILGFRNVGLVNSVTPYSGSISNNGLYYDEQAIPILAPTIVRQNAINLSGENYFYMCSQLLSQNVEGSVSNIFAKILLSGNPGKVLFDSFVNMPSDYNEPIKEVSSIDFSFFNYNGTLYDFNGLDHSFTLEVVELLTRPYDINVSSRLGHGDIDFYTQINPVTRITT
jgi:hypothetical protein